MVNFVKNDFFMFSRSHFYLLNPCYGHRTPLSAAKTSMFDSKEHR